MTYRPSPCMRYACSTQATYSAGVTSPIMSVRLRIKVLRLRQLSMGFSIPISWAIASGGRRWLSPARPSSHRRRTDGPVVGGGRVLRASRLAAFAAAHEFAGALLAEPLGSVDDQLTAQEHLFDSPGEPVLLEEGVVHPAVPLRRPDRPRLLGVEQDEVGGRADGDRALPRKESEELGGSGRRQFDKAVERQPVLPHTAVEDQRQARLDPGRAVGNLAEIASALLLGAAEPIGLLTEAERTMVRRDDLEVVGPQAAPQRLLVRPRTQRRRHDVLRPLESRALVRLVSQEQIVGAGLGVRPE